MKKKIYIFGGGLFSYSCAHFATSMPAFGETAIQLEKKFNEYLNQDLEAKEKYEVVLVLTKMADPRNSKIVTNEDMENVFNKVIADPTTRGVIVNCAFVDYDCQVGDRPLGKHEKRLETKDGELSATLIPKKKLIGMFRKERKDIFVAGFKTTSNESDEVLYQKSLRLLKKNSLNLVFGNDIARHSNMIVTPEESHYGLGEGREDVMNAFVKMFVNRLGNTFTRSKVVDGASVDWNSEAVPSVLRVAVNHCIENGAYKPFLGKTVGHFAYKVTDNTIVTSKRKTNFNDLDTVGLVKIESVGKDEVVAYGAKPSVGGQSQRIIFSEHDDVNCILHFHCPLKEGVEHISVAPQWQNECGSHQCGKNTSDHLNKVDLGDGDYVKVVYLDNHGPNVVFRDNINPEKLLNFLDKTFDFSNKTGGVFSSEYAHA